ncbi:DUF6685 family protein [Pantoea dispersa]|uniref:DUF6685 family protein n=1 Tax=Pantoea dispersa TaxID=59814 RepID=UPI001F5242E2|nr:DUF6685 family protein [Pantoea dispersa]MCI1029630.1 hypothetical protein [Pantoea dispersa]
MNNLLMRIQAALMHQSDRLARKNFSHRMNEAALLFLDDVKLFRPTADADTMLRLDSVFAGYSVGHLPEELQHILRKVVSSTSSLVPDFDFRKIESLTASKGFGKGHNPHVNGSWYRNLSAWGRGMFPGKNLRSETLQDWEENIRHIEGEVFRTDSPVNVMYYEWYDRHVVSNTGGSHHAAKVIYQAIRDNLTYNREAVVEHLSINTDAVRELKDRYVAFIYQPRRNDGTGYRQDADTRFQGSLSELVGEHIGYIEPVHYSDNIRLAFIPRSELKVDETRLEQWTKTAIQAGKIISLTDYLNNPGPFHVKPYVHEVNDILLRPYESATRSLS